MKFTIEQLIKIWNEVVDEQESRARGEIILDGINTWGLAMIEPEEVDLSKEVVSEITKEDIAEIMALLDKAELEDFSDQLLVQDPTATCLEEVVAKYDADAVRKAAIEPTIKTMRKPVYTSATGLEHYLHLSDLHIPFQMEELEDIVGGYANRNYNLIINGDFLDCHDISTFPKSKAVGLNNEVKMATDYLRDWCGKFKRVFLISGNHEKRMASYIRKRISPEVVQLVEDDILAYIVNSLNLPNLVYNPGDTTNWYVQIDNVVCAHPDDYKGSTTGMLQTATHALGYFETYNKNVDVVLLGHTHHLGIGVFKNKIVAESGCLCMPQDYAASGRLNYKPQANGYVEFTSRNGKVSFNDIKLRFID